MYDQLIATTFWVVVLTAFGVWFLRREDRRLRQQTEEWTARLEARHRATLDEMHRQYEASRAEAAARWAELEAERAADDAERAALDAEAAAARR
jgi:hypothetical protein